MAWLFSADNTPAESSTNPRTVSTVVPSKCGVLIVSIMITGSTARTGGAPTWNSLTLSQSGTTTASGEGQVEVWYLLNPPAATANVSVPNSGSIAIVVHTATFTVATGKTALYDNTNVAATTGTNPTCSVSVVNNGNDHLLHGALFSGYLNVTTLSVTSPGVEEFELDTGSESCGAAHKLLGTASGSQAIAWTQANSDDYIIRATSFTEVSRVPAVPLTCSACKVLIPVVTATTGSTSVTVTVPGAFTCSATKVLIPFINSTIEGIPYFRSASYNSSSTTSVTFTVPTGTAENDILLCLLYHYRDSAAPVASPPDANWNLVDSIQEAGSYRTWKLYWKRATASESDYTFTMEGGGTSYSMKGGVAAFSDCVTSGSPIDAYSVSKDETDDFTTELSTITPTTTPTLGVVMSSGGTSLYTSSVNNGYTEKFDESATDFRLYVATKFLEDTSATGTTTITSSNTTSSTHKGGFQLNLKPPKSCQIDVGTSYSATVLADNPTAYWRLDETSGNAFDEIASYEATWGANILHNGPSLTNEINASTICSSTTGSQIYVPSGTIANPNTVMTIEFWLRSDNSAGQYTEFLRKYSSTPSPLGWIISKLDVANSSGRIYMAITTTGGSNQTILGTGNVCDNKPHHIVFVVEAGTNASKLYVDGVLQRETTITLGAGFGNTGAYFVVVQGPEVGRVQDEVAVYSTALTATQILDHYKIGSTLHAQNTKLLAPTVTTEDGVPPTQIDAVPLTGQNCKVLPPVVRGTARVTAIPRTCSACKILSPGVGSICVVIAPCISPNIYMATIIQGTDDATYSVAGAFLDSSLGIYAGKDSSNVALPGGWRFQNVTIAKDKIIKSATLKGNYYSTTADFPHPTILYGEAADDPGAWVITTHEPKTASTTTANVPWTFNSFSEGVYTSPDIKDIIQEIVNRSGWVKGNDLCIIWKENGVASASKYIGFQSYNYSTTKAAILTVEYTNTFLNAPTIVNSTRPQAIPITCQHAKVLPPTITGTATISCNRLSRPIEGLLVKDDYSTDTRANYDIYPGTLSITGGKLKADQYSHVLHTAAYPAQCVTVLFDSHGYTGRGGASLMAYPQIDSNSDVDSYCLREVDATTAPNLYRAIDNGHTAITAVGSSTGTGGPVIIRIYRDGNNVVGYFNGDIASVSNTDYMGPFYAGMTFIDSGAGEVDWFEARTGHKLIAYGLISGQQLQVNSNSSYKATESGGTATLDIGELEWPLTSVEILNASNQVVVQITNATLTDMGGGDVFIFGLTTCSSTKILPPVVTATVVSITQINAVPLTCSACKVLAPTVTGTSRVTAIPRTCSATKILSPTIRGTARVSAIPRTCSACKILPPTITNSTRPVSVILTCSACKILVPTVRNSTRPQAIPLTAQQTKILPPLVKNSTRPSAIPLTAQSTKILPPVIRGTAYVAAIPRTCSAAKLLPPSVVPIVQSTKTCTVDGRVKEIFTEEATVDGYVFAVNTADVTLSGRIKEISSELVGLDGYVFASDIETVTIDGFVIIRIAVPTLTAQNAKILPPTIRGTSRVSAAPLTCINAKILAPTITGRAYIAAIPRTCSATRILPPVIRGSTRIDAIPRTLSAAKVLSPTIKTSLVISSAVLTARYAKVLAPSIITTSNIAIPTLTCSHAKVLVPAISNATPVTTLTAQHAKILVPNVYSITRVSSIILTASATKILVPIVRGSARVTAIPLTCSACKLLPPVKRSSSVVSATPLTASATKLLAPSILTSSRVSIPTLTAINCKILSPSIKTSRVITSAVLTCSAAKVLSPIIRGSARVVAIPRTCSACKLLVPVITAWVRSTEEISVDGRVKEILTEAVTLDGYVFSTNTNEITLDGRIRLDTEKTLGLDGYIFAVATETVTLDGIVVIRLAAPILTASHAKILVPSITGTSRVNALPLTAQHAKILPPTVYATARIAVPTLTARNVKVLPPVISGSARVAATVLTAQNAKIIAPTLIWSTRPQMVVLTARYAKVLTPAILTSLVISASPLTARNVRLLAPIVRTSRVISGPVLTCSAARILAPSITGTSYVASSILTASHAKIIVPSIKTSQVISSVILTIQHAKVLSPVITGSAYISSSILTASHAKVLVPSVIPASRFTETCTLDGRVKEVLTEAASIDGYVFATNTIDFTIEGRVKGGTEELASLDGYIFAVGTKTATLDGNVVIRIAAPVLTAQNAKVLAPVVRGTVRVTALPLTLSQTRLIAPSVRGTARITGIVLTARYAKILAPVIRGSGNVTSSVLTCSQAKIIPPSISTSVRVSSSILTASQAKIIPPVITGTAIVTSTVLTASHAKIIAPSVINSTYISSSILTASHAKILPPELITGNQNVEYITLDGYIFAENVHEITINGRIKDIDEVLVGLDGIIHVTDIESVSLTGFVAERTTESVQLSGIVKETLAKTATVDGIVKEISTESITLDGIIELGVVTRETFVTLDGLIKVVSTEETTIDGRISVVNIVEISIDGIVKEIQTATFNIDGYIKGYDVTPITIDGIILTGKEQYLDLDGILVDRRIESVSIDGYVIAPGTRIISLDGRIRETTSIICQIGGIIRFEKTGLTFDGNWQELNGKAYWEELTLTAEWEELLGVSSWEELSGSAIWQELNGIIEGG